MDNFYFLTKKTLYSCIARSSLRLQSIKEIHDGGGLGGHFGRDKTTQQIEQRYHWPQLRKEVACAVVLEP